MVDTHSENPYEPSSIEQESSTGPEQPLSAIILPLIFTGTLIGAGLGVVILATTQFLSGVPMIVTPAIVWVATLAVLLTIFKKQSTILTKFGLSVALAVPAYILYVPACSLGSTWLANALPGATVARYWPSNNAVIVASAISFCIVFVLFAAIIRRTYRPKPNEGEAIT